MRVAIIFLACIVLGENPVSERLSVGTVISETVRASVKRGGVQKHVPGVIIKFESQTQRYNSFAMSNTEAFSMAVLPPDRYYVAAFDQNRYPLALDKEQARCFVLKEGETIEVGVALAASPPK
jgi:hypothetical protein